MTGVLIHGFVVGDSHKEGRLLLSMVDLYVGFALFSSWNVYREKSLVRLVIRVTLMMVLGGFTASLYVLIALVTSRGDWERLWLRD